MNVGKVAIPVLVIVCMTIICGCTMSDSDIQSYIDSHPDEVKAYVDSHGAQISSYLAEHPEILEQITLPETTVPIEPQSITVEDTPTTNPTEITTTLIPETTIPPTTVPTIEETTSITTIPTTTPTQTPTANETQSTTPTPTPTITETETTAVVTTTETPTPTTIATTATPAPTPTPYTSAVTGLQAIVTTKLDWVMVTTDPKIILCTMTARGDFDSGIGELRCETTWDAIREDGFVVGNNFAGTHFANSFTWLDIGNGDYQISTMKHVTMRNQSSAQIAHYDPSTELLTLSDYPDAYFTRGKP